MYGEDLTGKISNILEKRIREFRITGASVSITAGGETAYARGFGYSDVKKKVPVGPDTLFKIGSITKVFTAMAVMQMAEDGKIDIDKPVSEYIPGFSVRSRFPQTRAITVRDLLCHHSGLPCDNLHDYYNQDPVDFQKDVEFLKNSYLVCPPGKMFYYSNLGYNMLGVIISRVSKMDYHRYMQDVFLKNAGMQDTAILLSDAQKKRMAKPYNRGREQDEPLLRYVPPGGITSTANDMAKLAAALNAGGRGIFKDRLTLEKMFVVQHPGNIYDFNMNTGLGWMSGKPGLNHAGRVFWHDGGTPSYFSLFIIIPDLKLGLTMLTNCTTGAMFNHTVSMEILNCIMEDMHKIKAPAGESKAVLPLMNGTMIKAEGKFITAAGTVTVRAKGKKLFAVMPAGVFSMTPCRDGFFNLTFMLFGMIPLKLRQVSYLRLGILEIDGQRTLVMEQLGIRACFGTEWKKLNKTAEWDRSAGRYVVVNETRPRVASFELVSTPDAMVLLFSVDKMGRLRLSLDVIDDSEAVIAGCGRLAGETIIRNGADEILVMGSVFRKT
jgi:CubicO group peptidase (beta-lactamase class C family)